MREKSPPRSTVVVKARGGYDCREVLDFPYFLGVIYCSGVQFI